MSIKENWLLVETEERKKYRKLIEKQEKYNDKFIDEVGKISLKALIYCWLNTLTSTKLYYAKNITELINENIICLNKTNGEQVNIETFYFIKHKTSMSAIRRIKGISPKREIELFSTYRALLDFLEDLSSGLFKRKQYQFKMRGKEVYKAIKINRIKEFFNNLAKLNPRDSLIARLIFYGGKKSGKILNLKVNQLCVEENKIRFYTRHKNVVMEEPIIYPKEFITELSDYIYHTRNQRADSEFIFISKNGKRTARCQMNSSFRPTCKEMNIERVTPETLRATWLSIRDIENKGDFIVLGD